MASSWICGDQQKNWDTSVICWKVNCGSGWSDWIANGIEHYVYSMIRDIPSILKFHSKVFISSKKKVSTKLWPIAASWWNTDLWRVPSSLHFQTISKIKSLTAAECQSLFNECFFGKLPYLHVWISTCKKNFWSWSSNLGDIPFEAINMYNIISFSARQPPVNVHYLSIEIRFYCLLPLANSIISFNISRRSSAADVAALSSRFFWAL